MENQSSFDRLVITLSPAERAAMLEKVQAIISPEENSLVSVEMQAGKGVQDIELTLPSSLKAPIKKGEVVGQATYTYEGKEFKVDLIAMQDAKKSGFLDFIKDITSKW